MRNALRLTALLGIMAASTGCRPLTVSLWCWATSPVPGHSLSIDQVNRRRRKVRKDRLAAAVLLTPVTLVLDTGVFVLGGLGGGILWTTARCPRVVDDPGAGPPKMVARPKVRSEGARKRMEANRKRQKKRKRTADFEDAVQRFPNETVVTAEDSVYYHRPGCGSLFYKHGIKKTRLKDLARTQGKMPACPVCKPPGY